MAVFVKDDFGKEEEILRFMLRLHRFVLSSIMQKGEVLIINEMRAREWGLCLNVHVRAFASECFAFA